MKIDLFSLGCEYGDKADGCTIRACQALASNIPLCCNTCHVFFKPLSTTTTTTPPSTTSSTSTTTTSRLATTGENFEEANEVIEIPDPGVNVSEDSAPGFVGGGNEENMVTEKSLTNTARGLHLAMNRTFCTIVLLNAFIVALLCR